MPSHPPSRLKVLLLENIHPGAARLFQEAGIQVESLKGALTEDELRARLREVNVLGIRSRTHLTEAVLAEAKELLCVGAYCIGTNQVDLAAAERLGVPVFNAPFSNTRSVAELIIGEIIALSRQLGDRSREVHEGRWKKSAAGSYEVRGRTLGIVGYGHIGSQVGVLAELLGMQVLFHDIVPKLPIGNNRPCASLDVLLEQSDFVTLHVPATPRTKNLIGRVQLATMRRGSYLLNASRASVVDLDAAAAALRSGHLAGSAFDVFPDEPEENGEGFRSPVQGLPNVILTPHVGGSTEEAQVAIGQEVTRALLKLLGQGSTTGAVNFPIVESPVVPGTWRILNVHRNVPGVLRDINKIVSDLDANIHGQVLSTSPAIGYLVMDLDQDVSAQVLERISALPTSIRTRRVAN